MELSTYAVLADFTKTFTLETDASLKGSNAVLSGSGYVDPIAAYNSCNLSVVVTSAI